MNKPLGSFATRKFSKLVIPLIAALGLTLACSLTSIAAPAVTNTPIPTNTTLPTNTAVPPTPKPTNTPKPTEEPKVTLAQVEQALTDAGYGASQFSDGSGAVWSSDNIFEEIYTYNSGEVDLQVLNSLASRMDHMEQKLSIFDNLFPSDFMSQLRQANQAYAATVGAGVTGKPESSYGPVGQMKFMDAYYNTSSQTISSYKVKFALFFEQWTCPSGYQCTFPFFGNQQFTGQASFVFYEIDIMLT